MIFPKFNVPSVLQNRLWRNEVAQKKREKIKAAEAEAKEMQKFNMFKQVSQAIHSAYNSILGL